MLWLLSIRLVSVRVHTEGRLEFSPVMIPRRHTVESVLDLCARIRNRLTLLVPRVV